MEEKDIEQYSSLLKDAQHLKSVANLESIDTALLLMILDALYDLRN